MDVGHAHQQSSPERSVHNTESFERANQKNTIRQTKKNPNVLISLGILQDNLEHLFFQISAKSL